MRKLLQNLDREDGLDTVLEVPLPEETFWSRGGGSKGRGGGKTLRHNVKAWVSQNSAGRTPSPSVGRSAELQRVLDVIGASTAPLPVQDGSSFGCGVIKEGPIGASMAKYILKQYIAAAGGDQALNSIGSMYAMGKVHMTVSELPKGDKGRRKRGVFGNYSHKMAKKGATGDAGTGEAGGFVLWQKQPDLWCLEMMVSGYKMSAGSDGKVAWRQTPWHQWHASHGPSLPLHHSLRVLDPRSVANLFANSVCLGEKTAHGEDCFVLWLDAQGATLCDRSSSTIEVTSLRHTVWGYFSQRTGLLVQLEDSHLLRVTRSAGEESVYWETTMESTLDDYRPIDGVLAAHAGRTNVSLFGFGESGEERARTRMEETWNVEEVDFNVFGLSTDCFLPPADVREEKESGCDVNDASKSTKRAQKPVFRVGPSQVAAVDVEESSGCTNDENEK